MTAMQSFIYTHYQWFLAAHVISMVAWMAGMFYLPRLFVYHTGAKPGSELSETFKVMERRLLRAIINPAMIATFIFGIAMLWANPELLQQGWIHVKLTCVLILTVIHGMLARHRKQFDRDQNVHSAKYYRWLNEAPTILLIIIVIMVIVRPF
jgi:putative membrane protein